jgi:hypothetical protein
MSWVFIVKGYPDIGGAALVGLVILLYYRSDGALRLSPLLGAGVLGALAIIFRRHYAYAVLALYVAFGLDALSRFSTKEVDLRGIGKRIAHLFLMGLITFGLVAGCAPEFLRKAMSSSFHQSMAGWEQTPWITFKYILGNMGLPTLLLGLWGLLVIPKKTTRGTPHARVLLLASGVWLVVWVFIVRQGTYHYPHILPLAVAIGLTSLWLQSTGRGIRMWVTRIVIVAVLAVNAFVMLSSNTFAVRLGDRLPRFATADPVRPLVNPAYDEIARLVAFLRSHAQANNCVLVAASSPLLNFDILRSADASLYGQAGQKLCIEASPQVDSRDSAPVSNLMDAQFVVVAKPFQYHLAPDRQKVVEVLLKAFDEDWPAAQDFQRLPEQFTLGQEGTQVVVYERTRPPDKEEPADTAKRMASYMGGSAETMAVDELPAGSANAWVKLSSAFPVTIVKHSDDSFDISAHPVREQQAPETVIEGMSDVNGNVKISANIHFYDSRCAGAEILVRTDMKANATGISAGVFSPAHNNSHFEVALTKLQGAPIYIKVANSPKSPDNIDYCALIIENLQVKNQ